MTPTVAIFSPGAMGSAIGSQLSRHGVTVITSMEGRSDASRKRAVEAGFRLLSIDAALESDFVLSILPPDQALPLATELSARVETLRKKPVYVDCNAVSPATAQEISRLVEAAGASFVDGGIIGMPFNITPEGTTVFLSGEHAPLVEELSRYGVRFRAIGGEVGAASALKMCYGGITKGLIAIGSAMMLAAQRNGIANALLVELARSQPGLMNGFRKSIPDMVPKAARWVSEMEEISSFLGEPLPEAGIYGDIAAFYRHINSEMMRPLLARLSDIRDENS